MQSQLQKASALNLIINAINIWNKLYLEKAINYKESIGEYIDYNLISHISPFGWEHINMLGEYNFNLNELESTELHRPLNI
ncbi:Tn3 family transposase [Clostridium perfringens]|uniref:Tn3 family transposase n=1 Tax=Clostridium perfringens TaxID=1502 RepID=UPI0024BC7A05|nr:Tn3 family transposase [Clostridium perfringens]